MADGLAERSVTDQLTEGSIPDKLTEGSIPDKLTEGSMAENLVREAIAAGMESPFRETILEGVGQSEPMPMKPRRRIVPALAVMGISFVVGYLLGKRAGRASGW